MDSEQDHQDIEVGQTEDLLDLEFLSKYFRF